MSTIKFTGSRTEARAAASVQAAADAADTAIHASVKLDAFVQQFVAMSSDQVKAYVDANVTDLASAKTLLKRLAVMLLLLARQEYRN